MIVKELADLMSNLAKFIPEKKIFCLIDDNTKKNEAEIIQIILPIGKNWIDLKIE